MDKPTIQDMKDFCELIGIEAPEITEKEHKRGKWECRCAQREISPCIFFLPKARFLNSEIKGKLKEIQNKWNIYLSLINKEI